MKPESAYPSIEKQFHNETGLFSGEIRHPVMTLLDYFAGQALTCVMGSSEVNKPAFAKWAYDFAEEMIKERDRRK